ncbi:FCD domain-containing protein [Sphingomonas histidinilytica]|jgi:GntR family transcriptional regulator of vanillate catabolism|uniref:GntR family transcriptional regulator, vanillate catabolism transcriptional regulator n=1 Tax=Rhizorhabdus histidinilytica TaxID=439228 RepID=A0A1T5CWD6_9SPHN|nr:GntR family transcriptional regulator [Rhizorhabdus histidinilytica]MBO9376272.1 FCD domain-containing protein [Rhizorhabdus histidinilytica]QEH79082.1 GntR family transcriptional regulator [Sphingomonas sp. C8-2]SKB63651.1 GntR family transcriptional regulator, vanillate catabolism transcriptional regulator [Rhizorhabdus histidinilytica]
MIEPDTGTRGEAVAAWIRERIVNGELTPGTHLQEQAIGNLTGTSRTPVREALKLLQREQLVLYSPNRGYVVRRFSLKDILDAFDVRATLEGMVCRLVATKGLSAEADAKLSEVDEEMRQVAFGTTWGERASFRWFDLNGYFHKLLIEEADNPMLASVIIQTQRLPLIFDSNQRLRSAVQVSRMFGEEDTQRSYRDHKAIVSAIRARDAGEAERLMRGHILESRETMRRNFSRAYPDPAVDADGDAMAGPPAA